MPKRKRRLALPRSVDGRLARQVADVVGEECVAQMRDATALCPVPIPVGSSAVFAYRGEFYGPLAFHPDKPEVIVPGVQGAGFSSLSDLISEATVGGKRQDSFVMKTGVAGVVGAINTLANGTGLPAAQSAPTALAAGDVPTNTTLGTMRQANAGAGDTLHITTITMQGNAAPNTMVLYDRLWQGAVAMNSTAAQTISGVPTRYATTTAAGNLVWPEVRTVLPATAHNNTITYVDQSGNTAEASTAQAGLSAAPAQRMDFSTSSQWFFTLNSTDTGVRNLTSYQCSALVATGQIDLVIGRPLCFIPMPVANSAVVLDGINSAFNLPQVLDNAALHMLELKGVTTATTYTGQAVLVSG